MNHIISVHSYKGGTGKTLISTNLAYKLSEKYRVLLIEADFLMPCFVHIFQHFKITKYYNDFYSGNNVPLRECIVQSPNPNLDLIFSSPLYDPYDKIYTVDQKWHLNRLRALIQEVNDIEKYDYIIFDTPSGRNFVAISNLFLSNLAIVVIRTSDYSVNGTKLMLDEVYNKTKPNDLLPCFVVFNQIPDPENPEMKAKLEKWKTEFSKEGTRKVFVIPLYIETALNTALGKTIFTNEDKFTDKINEIHDGLEELFKETSVVTKI